MSVACGVAAPEDSHAYFMGERGAEPLDPNRPPPKNVLLALRRFLVRGSEVREKFPDRIIGTK